MRTTEELRFVVKVKVKYDDSSPSQKRAALRLARQVAAMGGDSVLYDHYGAVSAKAGKMVLEKPTRQVAL